MANKGKRKKINKYIAGLDGLRAIAVSLILLYHLFPHFFKGGFIGVSLFFVLSGYLVTWTSLRASEIKKYTIKDFYLKRIKRIYPLLFMVIFFSAGIYWLIDPMILDGRKKEILAIFLGFDNYFQIFKNADYFTKAISASPYTHLWAIAIEMQFYLIWPLLFAIYQKLRKMKYKNYANVLWLFFIVISIIVIQFTYHEQQVMPAYYGFISRMSALFIGVLLAIWQRSAKRNSIFFFTSPIYVLILSVISLIMVFIMHGQNAWTYRIGLLCSSLLAAEWIRLVANKDSGIGQKLEIPIFKWISKYSYEIYLWQYPVLFFFQFYHLDHLPLMWVIMVVVILFLAYYSHYFIDSILYILFGFRRGNYEKNKSA